MVTKISKQLGMLMEMHKLSFAKLAEKADVPVETVKNLYYGKVSNPKVETLFRLSKALGVSINYLLGESIHTKEEELLLKSFRRCGNHGKSLALLVAHYEAELTAKERTGDKRRIPCVVPLGETHDGLDFHSCEIVDAYTVKEEPYLAIEITANHFVPTYCKGDKVLLENRFPKSGERALFAIDCTLYCRTFIEHDSGYRLKCLNGIGKDFEFKRLDKVNCIGTCVGIIRDE